MAWWSDVDGCGTTIDQWMAETVAPLLLTLGQLDLAFDHPAAPEGEEVRTRADAERLGLDRCVASYILPENMLWWRLDPTGHRYVECLVREYHEDVEGSSSATAYWTPRTSRRSTTRDGTVISVTPHVVRPGADRPGLRPPQTPMQEHRPAALRGRRRAPARVLQPRLGADPLRHDPGPSALQGPEDFVQADGTIPIGPSWLLPKKKNTQGGATTYEGFDVVDFPKDGAESIRKNKADLRDDVDRDSALVRPTGREGVAQSGLSKAFDHAECNNRLAKIAKILGRAEELIAEMALDRPRRRPIPRSRILDPDPSTRPSSTCSRPADMASATASFQQLVAGRRGLAVHRRADARQADEALPARPGRRPVRAVATPNCTAYLLEEHRGTQGSPKRGPTHPLLDPDRPRLSSRSMLDGRATGSCRGGGRCPSPIPNAGPPGADPAAGAFSKAQGRIRIVPGLGSMFGSERRCQPRPGVVFGDVSVGFPICDERSDHWCWERVAVIVQGLRDARRLTVFRPDQPPFPPGSGVAMFLSLFSAFAVGLCWSWPS